MMGYNDAGEELNLVDSFKGGRKLRPLIPRPYLSHATNSVNSAYFSGFQCPDLLSLNHQHHNNHLIDNHKEMKTHQVVVSSRWNPTPEQLRTLEELYRRGTRTPSAEQIQHITAQLRRYGKIEGKNVFYWFQNHKARERQKRRRGEIQLTSGTTPFGDLESLDIIGKDKGANKIGTEVEQTKSCYWVPSSMNCCVTGEDSDPPIQGAEKADTVSAETGGWSQFDETEFQHNNGPRNLLLVGERNATRQIMVQPSSSSLSFAPSYYPNYYPITKDAFSPISISLSSKSMDQKSTSQNLNQLADRDDKHQGHTLQLFPLLNANNPRNEMTKVLENSSLDASHNKAASLDDALPYYQFL